MRSHLGPSTSASRRRHAVAPRPGRATVRSARIALLLACGAIWTAGLTLPETTRAQGRLHGDAAGTIEHDYVGAAKCKSCHKKELMGDQYGIWLQGPHKRAFEVLANEQSLAIATDKGLTVPPSEAPECLMCHVTAYGVDAARLMNELDPADGVQCESCHGPGRDYRKKKIMADRELAEAKGLWDPVADPGICLRCHNRASPTFDPARYTLPDGTTTDFDLEQAVAEIPHPIPAEVKGRYIELEKKKRAEEKARKGK